MAATPTEVLNEDIKDLKGDIREVRNKVDLVKEEIYRIGIAQAEMKGEFRLVKFLLTIMIMGIAGSIWQFFKPQCQGERFRDSIRQDRITTREVRDFDHQNPRADSLPASSPDISSPALLDINATLLRGMLSSKKTGPKQSLNDGEVVKIVD